jgi:3-methyladenine DNA glycosylase/8-oxoguanine DNA glycosylase
MKVPFSLKLKRTEGAFLALAEAIVYQQLHGKAAATILGRVRELLGDPAFTPRHVLGAKEAALRACGLSGAKYAALRDLAEKSENGVVPPLPALEKMSDDEIVERLTQVRGIGRWTVEMLLIFRLGRPDVFPVTDFGVRQGFKITFKTKGLPEPAQMHRRGEKWRPFRSVASWYMWRAVELDRKNTS